MAKNDKKVIIVGCGIAGLAAALKLSYKGLKVEVYDKSDEPGGKLRAIPSLTGPIDAGPTVFTLKPWFDQFFEEIDDRFENHLTISKQSILALDFNHPQIQINQSWNMCRKRYALAIP